MHIDNSDMLGIIEQFPKQCETGLELTKGMAVSGKVDKILVIGMGGSAVGGDILKHLMSDSNIPVFVSRAYDVPNFVDGKTLVFANSYSGNTEETLSALEDAQKKNAKIVAITSGGLIESRVKNVIKIPKGLQPRAALPYLFFPMLGALVNSGIIKFDESEIKELFELLSDVSDFKERGRKIADAIGDRIPLVYASDAFASVAYRWKTQLNENGKIPAFTHQFSELNHNEIVGYQSMDKKDFVAIYLKDKFDNDRIKKRMDITKEIISTRVDVIETESKGEGKLSRLFSLIYLGDFVSYYVAINRKIDPTPVNVIENLKKKLKE
jgi:glucose/mannose-6-phosphate isomerase